MEFPCKYLRCMVLLSLTRGTSVFDVRYVVHFVTETDGGILWHILTTQYKAFMCSEFTIYLEYYKCAWSSFDSTCISCKNCLKSD